MEDFAGCQRVPSKPVGIPPPEFRRSSRTKDRIASSSCTKPKNATSSACSGSSCDTKWCATYAKTCVLLAMLSEDGKSNVAETGATAVEAAEPNLKTDTTGNEDAGVKVKRLPVEAMVVEAVVTLGVEIRLTTPAKVELLDEL
nr:uncharacterized protein LOC125421422 [Ziziphus jujuba var. spinosa]